MIKYIGNRGWDNIPSSTLNECLEYLQHLDYVALDTETQGFDCYTKKLLLLQVGDKNVQYVINTLEIDILPLIKE